MANMIGRLGVVLGLDSAEFVKGMEVAGKKLEQFGQAAERYGKAGATSMIAMATAALALADELNDVAKANDVTIATVLNLQKALAVSGGSAENASKLFSSFSAAVDNAAQGSFQLQQTFAKTGVSLKDLASLSGEDLFRKTIAGIANIQDPMTRAAKAMELFGKAAKGVDFVGLNDSLQETNKLTEEQARRIADAAEVWDMLKAKSLDTGAAIASAVGPSLRTTLEYLQMMTKEGGALGAVFRTAFETVAVVAANVGYVVKGVALEVGAWINYVKIASTQGLDAAKAANDLYIKQSQMNRAELDRFESKILGGSNRNEAADPRRLDLGSSASLGRQVIPGVNTKAEALRKHQLELMKKGYAEEQRAIEESTLEWAKYNDELAKAAQTEREHYRMSSLQLDRDYEVMLLEKSNLNLRAEEIDYAKQVLSIRNIYEDRIREIEANEKLTRAEKEQALEREIALREKAIGNAKELLNLTRQTREGTFGEGMKKGFDDFIKNLPTDFENGKAAFTSMMDTMTNALQTFVRTGKINFSDLAKSMIQDIVMVEAKAQLGSIFKSAAGALTGGFGLGEIFKFMTAASPFGFADGGDPPVGVPSLVGERGPELFIPKTAGTIIPNGTLATAMGGGGGTTINYNGAYIASMSAIDTQSGIQFLSKNKQAVWAANQSASRSIPTSR
jgi:lambda family phage tail tape measure protein